MRAYMDVWRDFTFSVQSGHVLNEEFRMSQIPGWGGQPDRLHAPSAQPLHADQHLGSCNLTDRKRNIFCQWRLESWHFLIGPLLFSDPISIHIKCIPY